MLCSFQAAAAHQSTASAQEHAAVVWASLSPFVELMASGKLQLANVTTKVSTTRLGLV